MFAVCKRKCLLVVMRECKRKFSKQWHDNQKEKLFYVKYRKRLSWIDTLA